MLRRKYQRNELFRIARQMKNTNQDVVGEKCIRNNEGVLARGCLTLSFIGIISMMTMMLMQ